MEKGYKNVKVIIGGLNRMKEVGFTWWRSGDVIRNGEVLYRAGER